MIKIDAPVSTKNIYVYVIVAWIVFVGMVMAFGIMNDIQKAHEQFREQGEAVLREINERVSINETILEGFVATIDASFDVDHTNIRLFARYMQHRYPHIFMFEIVDKVKRENKTAFIEKYQNIYGDFSIKSFDYSGNRAWNKADSNHDFYLPIVFMEPFPEESKKVLGLDLQKNDFFRESFLEGIKTQSSVASVPFKLIEGPRAYLLHRQVLRKQILSHGKDMLEDAKFAVLVVNANSLINPFEGRKQGFTFSLYHRDFDREDTKGHLYHYKGRDKSVIETIIFPLLVDERVIDSGIETLRMYQQQQMGWKHINWWLIIVVFMVGIISFSVLMSYARSYHESEMKKLQTTDKLFFLANHDSLTGLANRNLLYDRLDHAMAQVRRKKGMLALFFLDLNNFKIINDTYGHEIGDKVLRRASERLSACIREGDTLARRSGDEFLILVENIERPDEILAIIEKIRNAFVTKFSLDENEFNVGISIGSALYPQQAQTVEDLMKEADYSMYEDKEKTKAEKI